MKKRWIALLLAAVMTLSLAACGGDTGAAAPPDASAHPPDSPPSEPQQPAEAPLDYPKSNITCIIPYGAGGTMDTLSRALFESIAFLDGKCVFSVIRLKDMKFYSVTSQDLDGIVEQLRLTKGVECAIFLYEKWYSCGSGDYFY